MNRAHTSVSKCDRPTKRIRLHNESEVKVVSLDVFDDRVTELEECRRLTEAEETFIRNARRMIRNREYARQSRINKSTTLIEMADTIASLRKEIELLKKTGTPIKCNLCELHVKEEVSIAELAYIPPNSLMSDIYEQHIEWF